MTPPASPASERVAPTSTDPHGVPSNGDNFPPGFWRTIRARRATSGAPWADALLIAALLGAANVLIARDDIGWLRLAPSPYCLLPLLMGCRYGMAAGFAAGLFAACVAVLGLTLGASQSLLDTLRDHAYSLTAFLALGALCGRICDYFRKREGHSALLNQHLTSAIQQLDEERTLMQEVKGELEQSLITHGTELSTLDTEIRRLFEWQGDQLYEQALLLLNRLLRVSEAAIYTVGPRRLLERKASLGNSPNLPEHLAPDGLEIVRLALERGTTVTVPEMWESGRNLCLDYLAAVPFLDSEARPRAVLLITGMPFLALNRKTIRLISIVCRWITRVMEVQADGSGVCRVIDQLRNQRVFTPEFFARQLELCGHASHEHLLPSSVLFFMFPGHPLAMQGQFEKLILPCVRTSDIPTSFECETPNLAVLLPLCGLRGAQLFKERTASACAAHPELKGQVVTRLMVLNRSRDWRQVWKELMVWKELGSYELQITQLD